MRAGVSGSFNVAPVLRRGALALASLAAVFYLAAQAPTTFGVWLQRNVLLANDLWPRQTHFTLDRAEAEWHQARKDPLEIAGWVTGTVPRQVVLRLSGPDSHRDTLVVPGALGNVPAAAPSADRVVTMGSDGDATREGRRLLYTIPSLAEPLEFHFRGGDNESRTVKVHVHDRPRVLTTRFVLKFPDYLKLEPGAVENPGADVTVPAGTTVELEAQADQELSTAWFRYGAGERLEGKVEGKTARAQFLPKENGFLDLGVTESAYQLESDPAFRIAFVVLPDRAPSVTLLVDGESRMLTPQGRFRYKVTAEDDHGFSGNSLKSWLRVPGEVKTDEELEPRLTQLEGAVQKVEAGVRVISEGEISVAELGLASGSTLSIQAFTADNDTLGGPKTGSSQKETFQIIDPAEFQKEMDRVRLEAQALIENLSRREEVVAQEIADAAEKLEQEKDASQEKQERAPKSAPSASKKSASSKSASSRATTSPNEASPSSEDASESAESTEAASTKSASSRAAGSKKAESKKATAKGKAKPDAKEKSAPKDSNPNEAEPKAEDPPESEPAPEETPPEVASAEAKESKSASSKSAAAKSGSKSASKASKSASSRASESASPPESEEPPASESPQAEPPGEKEEPFKKLGEEQSRIAKESKNVSRKLKDMANALRQNSLLDPAEDKRFKEEIEKPLDELAEERLPESVTEMEKLEQPRDPEEAKNEAKSAQRRAEKMSDELKRVGEKLAGTGDFREILQRLELIIDLQKQTIGETEKQVPAQPQPGKERPQ